MRLTQAYKLLLLILLVSLTYSQNLNNFNPNNCPDQLTETFLQTGKINNN